MKSVKENKMGVNRAALEYNVPKTTLKNRISERVTHGKKPGPDAYLTQEEEIELVDFLKEACELGHGKTKLEVIQIVKRIVEKKKKEVFEHLNFNGEGWWSGFMRRHPKMTLRTSDALSHCRANAVSQDNLNHYFSLLKRQLEESNLMDKASNIYNMDETGIPFEHKQL